MTTTHTPRDSNPKPIGLSYASLIGDPQAQLSQLLELNEAITTATVDLNAKNVTAMEAAAAADDAQLHLTALNVARDELLQAMKSTTPAGVAE